MASSWIARHVYRSEAVLDREAGSWVCVCGYRSLSEWPGLRPSYMRHRAGVSGQQCRCWVKGDGSSQRTWRILSFRVTRWRVEDPKT